MSFIPAVEARQLSLENERHIMEQTISRLEKEIAEACARGRTEMIFTSELPKQTIDLLKKLGYTVKVQTDYYHELFYKISWGVQ